MRPLRGLSWTGTAYAFGVIGLGLLIIPLTFWKHPVGRDQLPALVYLAAFTQIAALLPIRWRHGLQSLLTLPLVAVALIAPAGVGVIAWLCLYDGRRPSAEVPLWRLLFSRATVAFGFGASALVAATVQVAPPFAIPVRTAVMFVGAFVVTNAITAGVFAFLMRENYWKLLSGNVGFSTVRMLGMVCFGGGALVMLLQLPAGYVMGTGLLGLILAVRSNMTDAQRQEVERVQTLELLAQALDARDPLTELHSQRVSELAARLGEALELSHLEVDRLRIAGLLHDIGKIGVRDSILKKADSLDAEEWAEMKAHAGRGADMIANHSALLPLAQWVRYHHERMDGSGYPEAKTADDIPLGARILAVADSYDTITGPRVYRASTLTPREAVLDISRHANDWYDPVVVDALRQLHSMPPLSRRPPPLPLQPAQVASGFHILRRRRKFALLAAGMAISSLGDPLTTVAIVLSIFAATHNPLAVSSIYVLKGIATVISGALLGGMADRWNRRRVVVTSDLVRAAILLSTPFVAHLAVWPIFVAVLALAAAETIGHSAREASIPELVDRREIGPANAFIGTSVMISGAVGYPLAAALLLATNSSTTTPLFVVDAMTFVAAAVITTQIGEVGGGVAGRRITGAFRAAWNEPAARAPLLVAGSTAFFVAMTMPTIVILAYQLSRSGAAAFTLLELLVTAGMIAGTVLLSWRKGLAPSHSTLLGLVLMGAFSIGVALSPWLAITAIVLFVASAGNMIYIIGNRSSLQEASVSDHRGSVMVARFVVTQTMVIAGAAVGGALSGRLGVRSVYGIVGVCVLVIAVFLLRRQGAGHIPVLDVPDDVVDHLTPVPLSRTPTEYAERA